MGGRPRRLATIITRCMAIFKFNMAVSAASIFLFAASGYINFIKDLLQPFSDNDLGNYPLLSRENLRFVRTFL